MLGLGGLSAETFLAPPPRSPQLGGVVDLNVMETCETTRDFDDKLTAPAFGFAGAEDYYR